MGYISRKSIKATLICVIQNYCIKYRCLFSGNICPPLTSLISGSFYEKSCVSPPIWVGLTCQPKCDPGYELVSSVTRYTCGEFGVWSPQPSDVVCSRKYLILLLQPPCFILLIPI